MTSGPGLEREAVEAPLPDADDRARIATELEADFLVEAGAGSGKTTELVRRMVALVRSGSATVDQIAAVTFTRKAASELRERFQDALEAELALARSGKGDVEAPDPVRALDRALREVDRAFVGTIHAFCARLLRERPLEAGLDPGFEETLEDEEIRRSRRFWATHLERLAAEGSQSLAGLARVGLEPSQLSDLYVKMQQYADVDFHLDDVPPPDPADVAAVRSALDGLLDRVQQMLPRERPEGGWDTVQDRLRSVLFLRRITEWKPESVLYEALERLCRVKEHKPVQKRWADTAEGKRRAKELGEELTRFSRDGGAADLLLRAWWAHRYPVAVRFARDAAEAYQSHRRREGWLSFQDLLMVTADLLRGNPRAREDLGQRYRRLLVDEFQDTDPIQAEILFLLASSPEEGDSWREVTPRPGQLFVVGDPKQSIYRFRRADISIYDFVRRRFDGFGGVLRLTSNFRSRPAIADLVNEVFEGPGAFGPAPTAYQAPFAPMEPRGEADPPRQGVFYYELDPDGGRHAEAAADDARRMASWIARRTGPGGDRKPRDFLILAWNTFHLHTYARELEARNLPVQVSGAGVSAEAELLELLTVLRALADPGDAVATVAALVGMFFGLDSELLLRHREKGGYFDLGSPGQDGEAEVRDALQALGGWWRASRTEPADVIVGRMVEELGLVPHAAADELGQVRAGALLYGLDAVRRVGLEGDTSISGAVEAIEAALESREAEAPLEPGREDAVRVMNLHKAKGLEAPVVILAAPLKPPDHGPDLHVSRDPDGESRGWLVVQEREGWTTNVLARPLVWPELEEEERLYAAAEQVRLRYVAATRAGHELVVARNPGSDGDSPWACFHDWLERRGTALDEVQAEPPPPRARLERSASDVMAAVVAAEAGRRRRGEPTYRFETVTERAKGRGTDPFPEPRPLQVDLFDAPAASEVAPGEAEAPGQEGLGEAEATLHRGPDWGSAVHATLEAAARGVVGDVLRAVARAHLLEHERPVAPDGEPEELDALLETVSAVRASALWRRALAAERRLAEVPFAVPWGREEGVAVFLDGQVDLSFRESDGWVLVDYKTDLDPVPSRVEAYRRQLRAYGEAWSRVTGEPVRERLLFWTRSGDAEAV